MIQTHPQELLPLGSLKPADYNPREMDEAEMQRLAASLGEFGVVEPLVARREDRLLIGGHQRLEAIRRWLSSKGVSDADVLEWKVPVVLLDAVSDARAKVLNLALNKIHGDWDYGKLSVMLDSLQTTFDPAMLELTGFTLPEIEDISALLAMPPAPPPAEQDVDAVLAAQARRFVFDVGTQEEVMFCSDTLRSFGMTGPNSAAGAFVKAMRAAAAAPPKAGSAALSSKGKGGKKK